MDLSWLCFVAIVWVMIPVIDYGIVSRWNYGKPLFKARRTGAARLRNSAKTMNTRQESRSRSIVIRRDSVAAGDDVSAPHEKKITIKEDERVEDTLGKILASQYLPGIYGGKATWIVIGKHPIAVVAQQWKKPHYLVEPMTPTETLVDLANDHQLEFRYRSQVEPNEVVASLELKRPLPDQFGRDRVNKQTIQKSNDR